MPTFPHAKVELKIAIKKKKNHSLPLHKRNASRMWDYTTETDLRIAFPSLLISDLATGGSYLFLISCLMLLSYFCMSLRSLCSAHICHVVRLCSSLCPDFFPPFFLFVSNPSPREWRLDFLSANPSRGPSFHPLGRAALRTSSAWHSTGLRLDRVRQGSPFVPQLYNLICKVKSKNWKPKLKIIK